MNMDTKPPLTQTERRYGAGRGVFLVIAGLGVIFNSIWLAEEVPIAELAILLLIGVTSLVRGWVFIYIAWRGA